MKKALVVYWSGTGSAEIMAKAAEDAPAQCRELGKGLACLA